MFKKLLIPILILVVLSTFAFADLPNRLNITMSEIVYNNITYAKDFYLEEENTFCEIHGTLNITNPSEDTVNTIYIEFVNYERMITDFVLVDGRNATKSSGSLATEQEYGRIESGINNVELIQDLDDDNLIDYMYVNSTHLIFNLSSESNLLSIPFGQDISNAGTTPVTLNLINQTLSGTKDYANVTIIGETDENNVLTENMEIFIKEFMYGPIVLFIPELRNNNYTTFIYNITCDGTEPPVKISTNYSNLDHPDINRKVLAGHNWTVTQYAKNNLYLGHDVTNINITMNSQPVVWNETEFDFYLRNLFPLGDYTNVHGNGTSNKTWWWQPNGGILNADEEVNVSYTIQAPESVPFTATFLALIENISYDAPFLMSNLTINEINATAEINNKAQKRIVQPADDEENNNVTWGANAEVSVPINISYELFKVSLWVTSVGGDPNEDTGLNRTYNNSINVPLVELNLSDKWEGSEWLFNYTDSTDPPVVWITPEWRIKNKYGQILNFSRTVSGEDLYMKYIYVVHGYWLEIEKNITSIGEDQYHVFTYVENIGNGWTPKDEFVTVYDFVPIEFSAWNFSIEDDMINQTVGDPTTNYYGMSYRWNIPPKPLMNSSLGPKNGPDKTGPGNYSWNVSYIVNGTGDYRASELYIVGLDPLKVDGAFTSPVISVISGLQTYSKELIYVSIFGLLIVINIANLFITSNINKKLKNHK
ncbi:MAG: hypothetical protein ACLFPJ_02675 [Candidatus Woesearchaeota archaeon]